MTDLNERILFNKTLKNTENFYNQAIYNYTTVVIRNSLFLKHLRLSINAENTNDCIFFFLLLKGREKRKKKKLPREKGNVE
jgi:hypothetical protein